MKQTNMKDRMQSKYFIVLGNLQKQLERYTKAMKADPVVGLEGQVNIVQMLKDKCAYTKGQIAIVTSRMVGAK